MFSEFSTKVHFKFINFDYLILLRIYIKIFVSNSGCFTNLQYLYTCTIYKFLIFNKNNFYFINRPLLINFGYFLRNWSLFEQFKFSFILMKNKFTVCQVVEKTSF